MSLILMQEEEVRREMLDSISSYTTFLEHKKEWTVSDCILLVKLQDLTRNLDSERTGSEPHPSSLVWRLQALGSRLPTSWNLEVSK